MNNKPWYVIVGTFLGALLLACLVGAFFYRVRDMLPPFVIAFGIAWLLDPLLNRLKCRGCPRMLAVTMVFAIFMGIFVVGIIFVIPAMVDQAVQLSNEYSHYADTAGSMVSDFIDQHHDTLARLNLPTTFQDALNQYGNDANNSLKRALPNVSDWITSNAFKVLWLVLIPLLSFYILNDIHRLRSKALLFIPSAWRPMASKMISRTGTVFSNYVRGLVVACIVYSIVISAVLMCLHVKYGIVLGMMAGVLYAVPYLGAITILVLVFLVSATTSHGVAHAMWPTAATLITNESFDLLITPRILGKSVGLHPVLSIFAMMAGAKLFGLPGMILAVPVAASIQEIILEFYPELNTAEQESAPGHSLSSLVRKLRRLRLKKRQAKPNPTTK